VGRASVEPATSLSGASLMTRRRHPAPCSSAEVTACRCLRYIRIGTHAICIATAAAASVLSWTTWNTHTLYTVAASWVRAAAQLCLVQCASMYARRWGHANTSIKSVDVSACRPYVCFWSALPRSAPCSLALLIDAHTALHHACGRVIEVDKENVTLLEAALYSQHTDSKWPSTQRELIESTWFLSRISQVPSQCRRS